MQMTTCSGNKAEIPNQVTESTAHLLACHYYSISCNYEMVNSN